MLSKFLRQISAWLVAIIWAIAQWSTHQTHSRRTPSRRICRTRFSRAADRTRNRDPRTGQPFGRRCSRRQRHRHRSPCHSGGWAGRLWRPSCTRTAFQPFRRSLCCHLWRGHRCSATCAGRPPWWQSYWWCRWPCRVVCVAYCCLFSVRRRLVHGVCVIGMFASPPSPSKRASAIWVSAAANAKGLRLITHFADQYIHQCPKTRTHARGHRISCVQYVTTLKRVPCNERTIISLD